MLLLALRVQAIFCSVRGAGILAMGLRQLGLREVSPPHAQTRD